MASAKKKLRKKQPTTKRKAPEPVPEPEPVFDDGKKKIKSDHIRIAGDPGYTQTHERDPCVQACDPWASDPWAFDP